MSRWRMVGLAAGMVSVAAGGTAAAQPPAGSTRDPGEARFVYEDVERFAGLSRDLSCDPESEARWAGYLEAGTPGLKAFIERKGLSAASLRSAVCGRPEHYAALGDLPGRLRAQEDEIGASFAALREIFPEAVFFPTYYFVADFSAGGLADPAGVLISAETYAFPASPEGEGAAAGPSVERIPYLVAHEMVHVQQAMVQGVEQYRSIYGPGQTRLALAIREGSADFLAWLISGDHTSPAAHAYGRQHEAELWEEFRADRSAGDLGDWFFVEPQRDDGRPAELGYFIGFRIAQTFYDRAPDKQQAVRRILGVTDPETFLQESGYRGGG